MSFIANKKLALVLAEAVVVEPTRIAREEVAPALVPADVVVVEVQRGGAPQVAPAAGVDGGARAVVRWKEGDDGAEDLIGKQADQIDLAQLGRHGG